MVRPCLLFLMCNISLLIVIRSTGGGLRFHRADLQRTLLQQIPSNCNIHLSSRLKSYTETPDDVRLDFENGSTASCDLLVGADGIKSAVREIFLKNLDASSFPYIDPIRTVSIAYRGLIPTGVVEEKVPGHRAAKIPVMVSFFHSSPSMWPM